MPRSRWVASILLAGCGAAPVAPPTTDVTRIAIGPVTAVPAAPVVAPPAASEPDRRIAVRQALPLPDEFRRELLLRLATSTDVALGAFQDANVAEGGGRLDEARRGYFEIIKQYPQSPLVPYAYLAFGDIFLREAEGDPSKLPLARQAYQKVVAYPPLENLAYAYAWERLAATDTRANDFPKSLDDAKRAIEAITQTPTSPLAEGVALSARVTLVDSYATAGEPAKAPQFFRSTDPSNASTLVVSLGGAYVARGRATELAELYDAALSTSDAILCAGAARVRDTFHPEGPVGIVAVTRIESKRRAVCAAP